MHVIQIMYGQSVTVFSIGLLILLTYAANPEYEITLDPKR